VQSVIAFEEEVDGARQDEPHYRDEVASAEFGVESVSYEVGAGEEGGADAEEDGE